MPKLVNRGPAGLLKKIVGNAHKEEQKMVINGATNKIAEPLLHMAVDINILVPDPQNARLHPDRNLEAIMQSLAQYGQLKPVVVRKSNNIVVAGNGTTEAAKKLGWTKLAASFVEMTDAEAAGFALADNRTAELAAWDFEVVAMLDKILREADLEPIGWLPDEIAVLRAAAEIEEEKAPEELDEAPGDAELLMKLRVTIEDPKSRVRTGEVYKVGRHTLVIADVVRESSTWLPYLTGSMLFAPYPGPLLPLTLAGDEGICMLMVQPDIYVAGHILDQYKAVNGESEVELVSN